MRVAGRATVRVAPSHQFALHRNGCKRTVGSAHRENPITQQGLLQLATAASCYYNNAVGVSARVIYSNWRLELERILLHEMAGIVLLSLGHTFAKLW